MKLTFDLSMNHAGRLYSGSAALPQNSNLIGTVDRGGGDIGGLLWIQSTGRLAQINAGVVRALPLGVCRTFGEIAVALGKSSAEVACRVVGL